MALNNIDTFIILTFLIITLGTGVITSLKVTTIKEYALGDRNFSTGVLVATIVATWVSGSMFFTTLSNTYSEGLSFVITIIGLSFSFLIPAYILIPRMNKFLGKVSIAEVMSDIYGKNMGIIIAIAGIIGSAGSVAMQFKVFGNLYGYFLDISSTTAVIMAGLIVTGYSMMGGIRAVTYTDLIQFIAFSCFIPLLGVILWNQACGTGFIDQVTFNHPKFNYKEVLSFDNPDIWGIIALFFYFAIPHLKPQWFQRVSMARDVAQAKKAFIVAAFIMLIITIAIAWIPFLLFNLDQDLDSTNLIAYIINNYTIAGVKGLIIVVITAMAMSTADSYINASSVLFANDIYKPLSVGTTNTLFVSRIFSFFLGISAIALSFISKDLLKIMLFTNSFYIPMVTPILFVTILGFRTTTKSIFIGMLVAFIVNIFWKISGIKTDNIIFTMCINFIFLFGSHYLLKQEGGWTHCEKIEGGFIEETKSAIKEFNFIKFYKKHSPNDDFSYMGLGIYLVIYALTTMYSTQMELTKDHGKLILTIYQLMLVSGVVLTMYPIWPQTIKKIEVVQIAWPIVIWVNLIFLGSFFVIVSDFNQLQFVVFTANLILAIILAGWKLATILIFTGFYASIQFYTYYMNIEYFDFNIGSPQFVFLYSLVLLGTVVAIFLKPKQDYVQDLETEITHLDYEIGDLGEKIGHYDQRLLDKEQEINRLGSTAQKILNNVNHELRLPVGNVMNFAEMLNEGLGKFSKDQLKTLSDEVYKNSTRLSSMILNMLDFAMLDAKKVDLEKATVNFSELVKNRVKICRNIYLQGKKLNFQLSIEPELLLLIDPNYMRQLVDNLVINSINFSTEGTIKVKVWKHEYKVMFTIIDQGVGIPKEDIYDIFTPFKMGSNTESKAEGRGVGLALCKAAIEAHSGRISVMSENGETIFKVELPR